MFISETLVKKHVSDKDSLGALINLRLFSRYFNINNTNRNSFMNIYLAKELSL